MATAPVLVCPGCGTETGGELRFCPECGLPLVLGLDADGVPRELPTPSGLAQRARQIKPQLAEGPLTKVAWARNQAEGEMLQALLLEQGVPSLLRRSPGFDVPDMLFAGPRDVLVAASGVDTARETLQDAQVPAPAAPRSPVRPGPLLVGLLLACVAAIAVIWALSLVVHH